MATRDELYCCFGPLQMEAITLVILDEVNAIRTTLELEERTEQYIIDAIVTKLASLENYTWM